MLPGPVREYIDGLQERTVVAPYLQEVDPPGADAHDGRWFDLSEAVAGQHSVFMTYHVPSRDEDTKRKVDPLALVYYSDAWNLVAFDHLRRDVRSFRLDRIRKMRVLSDQFHRPKGFDLQAYLQEKGSVTGARRIAVRFDAATFPRARRTIPAQVLELSEDAEGVTVSFMFDNLAYLADWLLHYGTGASVIVPPELREELRARVQELLRHHQ